MNTWKVICATLVIFVAGIVTGGVAVGFGARIKNQNIRPRENFRPSGNVPNQQMPQVGNLPNPGARDPRSPLNFAKGPQSRLMSLEFLEKLHKEIGLTQGQRERIAEIMADGQQRNKKIWERIEPDLRREMQETQKRIREILNEDQRKRWEELMKQQRPQRRPEEPGQSNPRQRNRQPLPNKDGSPAGTPQSPD